MDRSNGLRTAFFRTAAYLLSVLPSVGTAACHTTSGDNEIAPVRQAIVNGEQSDERDDSAVYVYWQLSSNEGSVCTGSMIAPNLIATALHCVSYATLGEFSCRPDGTLQTDNPGDGEIGATIQPSLIQVFTGTFPGDEPAALGKRVFGTGSNQSCRNDIAFVVLDRDVDAPIVPVRLAGGMRRGENVRVVGYGQTEVSGSSGRFRRAGLRIVDVGPDSDGADLGTTAPRTFVVGEGPCHGDSGGPAISETTGALLGVSSLSAGATCTAVGIRNVFTRLEPFAELAAQAFTEAGHDPILEETEPSDETPGEAPRAKGCSASSSMKTSPGSAFLGSLLGFSLTLLRRRRSPKSRS